MSIFAPRAPREIDGPHNMCDKEQGSTTKGRTMPEKPTFVDVVDMARSHLEANGYDGLVGEDGCGCSLSGDFVTCGDIRGDCVAGYRTEGCSDDCGVGGGCDFHINPGKRGEG